MSNEKYLILSINEAHRNLLEKIRLARAELTLKPGQKNRFIDSTTLVDAPVSAVNDDQAYIFNNARVFINRGQLLRHCRTLHDKVDFTLEVGTQTGRHSAFINDIFEPQQHYAIIEDVSILEGQFKSTNMIFLEGSSGDMIPQIPKAKIDFCYVDGGHGYNTVRGDINALISKVKQRRHSSIQRLPLIFAD